MGCQDDVESLGLNDSFLISIHNRSLLFSFMLCFKLLSFYFYLSTFSIEYTSLALSGMVGRGCPFPPFRWLLSSNWLVTPARSSGVSRSLCSVGFWFDAKDIMSSLSMSSAFYLHTTSLAYFVYCFKLRRAECCWRERGKGQSTKKKSRDVPRCAQHIRQRLKLCAAGKWEHG